MYVRYILNYFRSSCPVYSVFSSPSLRWIRSCLHTAPPLLSVRTVNNTQGISVQGAQTSSPPPSPIHVKQCTLYSRDNCRGRRIYLRGFYTVCVAFQCGLLPKKHCKGWDYRVSHKLPTLHHRTLVKWQPDLQAEKRMRDVNFISPKPLSSNSQSLFSTPL